MSLLRRIEQGQGSGSQDGGNSSSPVPSQPGGKEPSGGENSSRLSSLQARRVSAPITSPQAGSYFDLKTRVQNKLLAEIDPSMDVSRTDDVRRTIQGLFEQILSEENIVLSRPERARLFEQIAAEILGFGPLQPLLEDTTITAIMVNGPKNLYIERKGQLHRVPVTFENNDHVMRIIDRIVTPDSRRVDESQQFQTAALLNGYSAKIVIPPMSLIGPQIYIKKILFEDKLPFYVRPIKLRDITTRENLKEFCDYEPVKRLLSEITKNNKNILVISEAGVGKSTFINELLKIRGTNGLVIRLHNTLESNSVSSHILDLETILPSVDNQGSISRTDLWKAALKIRPELMVFESEDDDPLAVLISLLSLNTWTTSSGRSSLQGLENFVYQIHDHLPAVALAELRAYIANSLDYVLYIKKQSGMRWIDSCDKLTYDRIKDEFILTSQLQAMKIEIEAKNRTRPDSKLGNFFKGIFQVQNEEISEKPSAESSSKVSGTTAPTGIEQDLQARNSIDDIEGLLQKPEIDHVLIVGNAILSSSSNQIKFEGKNALKQEYLFELAGWGKYSQDVGLPPYASLPTSNPAISRVEIITSALGSLEKNICVCKAFHHFPDIMDLIKDWPIELQNHLQDVIRMGGHILISGLPGSGKTTLLNSLAEHIFPHKHIVALEYIPELRIQHQGLTTLLIQPTLLRQTEETRQIDSRVLLNLAPDYLILDGDTLLPAGELYECLRTVSVMASVTSRSAVHALEILSLRFCSDMNIQATEAHEIIANFFDIVLQIGRLADGTLRISEVIQLAQNGNFEKIKNSNFQDVFVNRPETIPHKGKFFNNLPNVGQPTDSAESTFVSNARSTQADEKQLLEILELSSEIFSRQKAASLAKREIQKLLSERMVSISAGEQEELVDMVSFAGRLPSKLFSFFANPSANHLIAEESQTTRFSFKDGKGICADGNLNADESKILRNEINAILINNPNTFVGSPEIGRVQYLPWLEVFWVFQPFTPIQAVWMLRKRPRQPLTLDRLEEYFEIDTTILNKLRNGLKNQLNILVMGNSHHMPELVIESLINSDDGKPTFGMVSDFGRIQTLAAPELNIDAMEFSNFDSHRFGTMVSDLISSPEVNTLVLAAYPNTLDEVIRGSKQKRILACSTLTPKVIPALGTSKIPSGRLRGQNVGLRTTFDLIMQVTDTDALKPKINLVL